jgi:tRNA G18 (ribose-2'-O)-methylase SpoU
VTSKPNYVELGNVQSFAWNICDTYKGLALEDIKQAQHQARLPYAVCALNVCGDLNIGVMMRNSVIMGAAEFIIVGRRQYDRRSTVGAQNYIPVHRVDGMLDDSTVDPVVVLNVIEELNYTPVFVEQGGTDVRHYNFAKHHNRPFCLVFGNEGNGIPNNLLMHGDTISVRQRGVLRSLNVSSTSAIVLDHVVDYFESVGYST